MQDKCSLDDQINKWTRYLNLTRRCVKFTVVYVNTKKHQETYHYSVFVLFSWWNKNNIHWKVREIIKCYYFTLFTKVKILQFLIVCWQLIYLSLRTRPRTHNSLKIWTMIQILNHVYKRDHFDIYILEYFSSSHR